MLVRRTYFKKMCVSCTDLKSVFSRVQVSNVHPLTVDVVGVGVSTARTYALVSKVSTFKHRLDAREAVVVFETKGSFMALSHLSAVGVYYIVMCEHLHTVVVPRRSNIWLAQ